MPSTAETHYLSNDDLFGSPATEEASLPAAIAASLDLADSPDAATRIYAPLGVGKHVDHQIVHLAAQELAARGWDVWFYEDIPYALKPMALDARLTEIGAATRLEPVARVPAQSTWEQKIDAILRYPSQLETVFRQYVGVGTTREEISEALTAYAARAGDGVMAERFWRLSDAPDRSRELTRAVRSARVYVLRCGGPDHGGRERNPPRIPACGSPLDPVGDVHPGTRPAGS